MDVPILDEALDDVFIVDTATPAVIHPEPYIILTDENSLPPGEVRTIWSTLFNLTDYVVWTRYVDNDGNVVEKAESITFLTSLLSLLDPETDFLLHQMDIDDDGDDDDDGGAVAATPPAAAGDVPPAAAEPAAPSRTGPAEGP